MRRSLMVLTSVVAVCTAAWADTTWVAAGPVWGEWDAVYSPYMIQGDIFVPATDTLQIGPGTEVFFDGPYGLRLDSAAVLWALGAEGDSVVFHTDTLRHPEGWRGISFLEASPSLLTYCRIEHGRGTPVNGLRMGGGLYCTGFYAELTLRHCRFEFNAANYGGGIHVSANHTTVENCVFRHNQAQFLGGAIYGGELELLLDHCLLTENIAREGSAIATDASTTIRNCTIVNNTVTIPGRGQICASNYSFTGITNSIVAHGQNGSGFIYYRAPEPSFSIRYCCIFGNDSGPSGSIEGSYVPWGFGSVARLNANGDSCDTFDNLFFDPLFADTAGEDYHLTLDSPCIDAGSPNLPDDPDSTRPDIGAFFFDQSAAAPHRDEPVSSFTLYLCYPNPFNAVTRLAFELPQPGRVRLTIYDLTGREVAVLADDRFAAGRHELRFDGSGLASGLYFARLVSGSHAAVQKLVLLK